MNGLHFIRPLWLLALLALPVLAWWWRKRQREREAWRTLVDPHLLPALLQPGGKSGRRMTWPLLALATAIVALAGPAWRQVPQPLWQSHAPLVIALDLSSATLANDLPPSRLLQARAKIAALLQARAGGQVGLVAFSDDAYTVAPLTDDVANVALFLDALAPDVMPVDGHRVDRAIAWSARLLRQAGFDRGDILLLTDHAGGDDASAARSAALAGYRVSVLGLGTERGAAYRDANGAIAQARLDPRGLRTLAASGDGDYAALSADDADLRALGMLAPPDVDASSTQGETRRMWEDAGYWLLPVLMLLALFAFRRGGALAAMALGVCLLPMVPAHAQDGTLWRRADQQAHQRSQTGEAAYRKRDYAGAASAYGTVASADGQYNLGNALAQQGRYDDAIAAYDRALKLRPGMADALANRKVVEDAKRRQPPSGGQRKPQPKPGQSPSQPGEKGQRQDDQDGQSSGSSAQSAQQPDPRKQPSTSRPGDPDKQADAQPPRNDPAAQRAADAAQRQRMQQAMNKRPADDGTRADGPRVPVRETPQQREQRLANEAWLRRVPDDPGGLLRAKFALEHERRQRGGGQ